LDWLLGFLFEPLKYKDVLRENFFGGGPNCTFLTLLCAMNQLKERQLKQSRILVDIALS